MPFWNVREEERRVGDEVTLVWQGKAELCAPGAYVILTGLCGLVQVQEEDLQQ